MKHSIGRIKDYRNDQGFQDLICSPGNYCDQTGFIVCNCERGTAELLQRSLQLQMIYLCRKWPGQTAARSPLALLSIIALYGFKDMLTYSFVCKSFQSSSTMGVAGSS